MKWKDLLEITVYVLVFSFGMYILILTCDGGF